MAEPAPPALRNHLLWATWLLPALIFIIVLTAVSVLHRQNLIAERLMVKETLTAKAREFSANIEHHLNSALYMSTGLVSYIEAQQGQIDPKQFEPWIIGLIKQSRHLRNIGIAPNNRLLYVYPRKGNEQAIGLYYPDNPVQWPAVKSVIEKREPVLTGPLQLAQGGLGFIYRAPVFVGSKYWGIVSIVINADSLFKEIQEHANALNIQVALFHTGDHTQRVPFFGEALSSENLQIDYTIEGPNVQWQLSVYKPTPIEFSGANAFAFIGIFVSVFVTMLSYLVLRGLRRQVELGIALEGSEQRFAHAFYDAPQGMLLVDSSSKVLSANAAMLSLLGLSQAQIQHRSLASFFAATEAEQCHSLVYKIATGEIRNAKLETFLLDHQSSRVDVAMSLALLSGNEPQSDRIIVQFHDLRQRLALERMKQGFVSTVSHELRTPVTAVSASLLVLASEQLAKLPNDVLKLVQIAERNAKRLQRLVNDLLDFDALGRGETSIHITECQLTALILHSLEQAKPLAEQKNILINLVLSDDKLIVNADEVRLQQVFDNLFSNAIKFSPSLSQIDISVSSDENHALVSVRDYGPGISAEFQAQVFDRFAQENSGNTRKTGGAGLGLAISRRLMQQMHGDIQVSSEKGNGSTFTVSLSLVKAQGAPRDEQFPHSH